MEVDDAQGQLTIDIYICLLAEQLQAGPRSWPGHFCIMLVVVVVNYCRVDGGGLYITYCRCLLP